MKELNDKQLEQIIGGKGKLGKWISIIDGALDFGKGFTDGAKKAKHIGGGY
ncbi:lactococcin G-beta/enterocin 1071B family bacteriocin [Enterococcus gilvus]|uniref:lactococcin G-beta/enterocin 1071B family bacteriocin n=1 Tax=Enterococcus gilvus TaxID=160453 RepID=UPI0028D09593|nr:lactococcin G-beta/enterocin 1071B family bacteriocin [Enterococcus gilvus]